MLFSYRVLLMFPIVNVFLFDEKLSLDSKCNIIRILIFEILRGINDSYDSFYVYLF